ncbi:class C sortase [Bifidobacterium sp. ESL0790]|uniref:class C sortase n=1 Tax=Bifidobacterium sp. ESL0790 TaxID=2983233 RepID=UPI0023F7D6FB|nr:class C sortase [Bifidobacterium sp. ESL0790]WEV72371.1 class C sortase [Bifidobacterium sp. ESL0790]
MASTKGVTAGAGSRAEAAGDVDLARTFQQIIADKEGSRLGRRVAIIVIDALIVICLIALVVAISWFPARWMMTSYQQNADVAASVDRISKWPQGKVADEYHRAQAYNAKVAASGQPLLGEFVDPFDTGNPKAKPKSEKDQEYQSLLNDGTGMMGTIRIPKISVKMPIYHGTSDAVLQHGAGHLYGTSLPVGGPSTNAVLSGHTGLQNALLFTRIDELKKGDIFYVQTLGRTMGYRVVGIHVIKPDDTHLYKIVPGQDLVTLMTCTPYGVNTERLIITGTRQPIPEPIPEPDDAKGDPIVYGVLVALGGLVIGLAWVRSRHRKPWTIQHSAVLMLPPHFGRAPWWSPFAHLFAWLTHFGTHPGAHSAAHSRQG